MFRKRPRINYFDDLPDEMKVKILSYFSHLQQRGLKAVCADWNRILPLHALNFDQKESVIFNEILNHIRSYWQHERREDTKIGMRFFKWSFENKRKKHILRQLLIQLYDEIQSYLQGSREESFICATLALTKKNAQMNHDKRFVVLISTIETILWPYMMQKMHRTLYFK